MKLRRSSLKELMVVIFSGIVALGIMSMCTYKVWTWDSGRRENGGAVYVSPEGADYYVCPHYETMSFELDKKIGKCRMPSERTARIYSIKGVDADRFVAIENTKGYLPWEGGPKYLLLARSGEEDGHTDFDCGEWSYTRTIDYTVIPVSAAVFIPYPDWLNVDDEEYLNENGIFGEEAANAMADTFSQEPYVFCRREIAGQLILRFEGYDWLTHSIQARGTKEEGYELVFGAHETYLLPDSTVEALGINKQ